MRKLLYTSFLALASCLALVGAERQTITVGTAVNGGPQSIVVGEAAAGTLGSSGDWHITAGQTQGIANIVEYSSVENIVAPEAQYNVYPNPTTDIVNVSRSCSGEATLTLSALNGAELLATTMNEPLTTLSLRDYPSGVYLLTINQGSSSSTVKIIKL